MGLIGAKVIRAISTPTYRRAHLSGVSGELGVGKELCPYFLPQA